MDIDAAHLGDGPGREFLHPDRPEGLSGALARLVAQELDIARRCAIARGQDRLIGLKSICCVLEAPMAFEHAYQPLVRPCGDLKKVFRARIAKGAESRFAVSHDPGAIRHQAMEMGKEAQRRIEALDERDGSHLCVVDAGKPEGALDPPPEQAHQGLDERLEHVGAQAPIEAHGHSESKRQGADPLAISGLYRQNGLYQVRGNIGHPASTA